MPEKKPNIEPILRSINMKEKMLKATLKEIPTTVIPFRLDFERDFITGNLLFNEMRKRSLLEIKQQLHEKIALLDLEDIKFEIIEK